MEIKIVKTCPLGSKCEEIKDGAMHVCAWYKQLQGTNPQTGDPIDIKDCAIAWLPILMVENTGAQKSSAAATESLRNETVKAPDIVLSLLGNIAAAAQKSAEAKPLFYSGPNNQALSYDPAIGGNPHHHTFVTDEHESHCASSVEISEPVLIDSGLPNPHYHEWG